MCKQGVTVAQGNWTEPGQGTLNPGRRLQVAMYRPPNNRVCSVLLTPDQENMNDDDWQYLLDGLAAVPGMAVAILTEGAAVSREMSPGVAYEPLPEVDDS